MKPDSHATLILKILFLKKRPVTTKEISALTGISITRICGDCRKLMGIVKKEKKYGETKYWIPDYEINYVKNKLHNTLGNFEDDESDD